MLYYDVGLGWSVSRSSFGPEFFDPFEKAGGLVFSVGKQDCVPLEVVFIV
jgi:hypothetical protein